MQVRDLAGKSWEPETWDRDIWVDAHEVTGEMDSTSTLGLSGFAEVAHPPLVRAPLCWEMLPKLLPGKATVLLLSAAPSSCLGCQAINNQD